MTKKKPTKKPRVARDASLDEMRELRAELARLQALVAAPAAPVPVVEPDEESPGVRLDLGGGENPREGYASVDAFAPGAAHRVNLWNGERWPFEDGSVDALHSSHTIEHIDAAWIDTYHREEIPGAGSPGSGGPGVRERPVKMDALMFFFTEAFRVLKPGGAFTLVWPALQNVRAFMDPTHRRFIPRETMIYLDKTWRDANKLDHYLAQGRELDFKTISAQPSIPEAEATKPDVVQMQNANDHWNFFQDWIVTLNKPGPEKPA